MAPNPAKQYLESRIKTVPKEELLLLLLDGAVRFAEQGKARMIEKDWGQSCPLLIRSQRIATELRLALRREIIGDEIYGNLVRLYNFVYRRLVEANLEHSVEKTDEALAILRKLREMWGETVERARLEKAGAGGMETGGKVKTLNIQG